MSSRDFPFLRELGVSPGAGSWIDAVAFNAGLVLIREPTDNPTVETVQTLYCVPCGCLFAMLKKYPEVANGILRERVNLGKAFLKGCGGLATRNEFARMMNCSHGYANQLVERYNLVLFHWGRERNATRYVASPERFRGLEGEKITILRDGESVSFWAAFESAFRNEREQRFLERSRVIAETALKNLDESSATVH